MVDKVVSLSKYKKKKENDALLEDIENDFDDKPSLRHRIHVVKEKIVRWYNERENNG